MFRVYCRECRSSQWRCFIKKLFLKISRYSQENTCVGVSFLIKLQALRPVTLLKRDSDTGFFSCEYCEIFKNTYFEEHLRTAVTENIPCSKLENNGVIKLYFNSNFSCKCLTNKKCTRKKSEIKLLNLKEFILKN